MSHPRRTGAPRAPEEPARGRAGSRAFLVSFENLARTYGASVRNVQFGVCRPAAAASAPRLHSRLAGDRRAVSRAGGIYFPSADSIGAGTRISPPAARRTGQAMRTIVCSALALAFLAGPFAVASEQMAADAATAPRLPDLRCFSVQGRCEPGAVPIGQTWVSPNQIHNAFVVGWGPTGSVVGNVWKHLAVSNDWVASANILPVAVHCDTYLVFVKNPAGAPQELWCIAGTRLLLLWEML